MRAAPPPDLKRRPRRETSKPIATTVQNTCHLTGLGRTKVYELIAQQKLKTVAIGRRRLVLVKSIEALLRPTPT